MMFTIFSADATGNPTNCVYPHRHDIFDEEGLKKAVCHDYVCAGYKKSCRSNENFLGSNCLAADCDNDHSENPADWVTPSDVAKAFPDVAFAVHYSRNNGKPKNGKAARPKFHVFFPVEPIRDPAQYSSLKQRVHAIFPYFDRNALDAARFFFGTAAPEVAMFPGSRNLSAFLEDSGPDPAPAGGHREGAVIPEGSRNTAMSHFAGRILKRCGDTPEAYRQFLAHAHSCNPPLDSRELETIWRSALRFYAKVAGQADYIPPEQFSPALQLIPSDFSDVGQAAVLAREYRGRLRYSLSTDYLVYNGSFWEESKPKAQAAAQALTAGQLKEAKAEIQRLTEEMNRNGAWTMLSSMGRKKAAAAMNPAQQRTFQEYRDAIAYRDFATRRRDSKYIASALKEAQPMLEINPCVLDADGFLLNTPSGTYDLREGRTAFHAHDPKDFLTKQAAVDPDDKNAEIWQAALDTFFTGDPALEDYVQEIAGLASIGKVCLEALIIAYGEGRNGKSTFWNVISRVLGTYSGSVSADTLTVGCKRNVKPELAEARGKRLLIAAELEEGMRLSTANVKNLCSTDEICAEKKYKDPFSYVPTHTLVLYTNHLPKVGALDAGIWRRLIVIPFNAVIEGNSDIRNYADYLFENCGGAILSWIMEGAARVIGKHYKITRPRVVEDAIRRYRDNNDWLSQFLEECCEVGPGFTVRSGDFYNEYRSHCLQFGEYARSTTDFYTAIEQVGLERKRMKAGVMVSGVRLKQNSPYGPPPVQVDEPLSPDFSYR